MGREVLAVVGRQAVKKDIRGCRASGYLTEEQYGNGIITDRVYIPQNGLLKQIRSYVGISTNPTVQEGRKGSGKKGSEPSIDTKDEAGDSLV